MIYLIVGHRGVGKTEFLKKVQKTYSEHRLGVKLINLDDEISHQSGLSIGEIFNQKGEDEFRALEAKTLLKICNDYRDHHEAVWISLGAGYQGDLPNYVKVIWLRRRSDVNGRVFLDRPRLDAEMNPLDEYRARFLPRSARFRQWHHKQIMLPEGDSETDVILAYILGFKPAQMNACITVLPEIFADEIRLEDFITEKLLLGVRYFELRDDLLSAHQIDRLLQEIPNDKVLISFRIKSSINAPTRWWAQLKFDWSIELGPCPFGDQHIRSLHYRGTNESFEQASERLMSFKADHYKLALPINDINELWKGHSWYLQDPAKRSFLPMSRDGRWNWYRSLMNERMYLNFVCDSEGSSFDQPSLYDWLSAQTARPRHSFKELKFAAIIGDPVGHSYTPQEQGDFFRKHNMPVLKVTLGEDELNEISLSTLRRMGLAAAAVTAPLKRKMTSLCGVLEGASQKLGIVNTLFWNKNTNQWLGTNTDIEALEDLIQKMSLPKNIIVWGGGAMRLALMRLLPNATFFSARRGEEVQGKNLDIENLNPQMLIWGVGRSLQLSCQWPNVNWKPLMVFDLNYAEDSPGREYAQKVGATYISGLGFFQSQAEKQRQFWSQHMDASSKDMQL